MQVQFGYFIPPSSSVPPAQSSSRSLHSFRSVSNDNKTLTGHTVADTTLPMTAVKQPPVASSAIAVPQTTTALANETEAEWLETYFPEVEPEDIYHFAGKWGVSDLISVAAVLVSVQDKIDRYREVSADQVYLFRAMPTKVINYQDRTIANWKGACAAINNRHDLQRASVKGCDIAKLPTNFMHTRDLPHGGINFLVSFLNKEYANPYMREDYTAIRCKLSDVFAARGRVHTDYGANIPNCIVVELPEDSVIPFELVDKFAIAQ